MSLVRLVKCCCSRLMCFRSKANGGGGQALACHCEYSYIYYIINKLYYKVILYLLLFYSLGIKSRKGVVVWS